MADAMRLTLGISECLLGAKVRFDGGDKKDRYITGVLGEYIDFIPVCPEVAIGLGVPRPPIRQVGNAENPEVVGVKDPSLNVTKPLQEFSNRYVQHLPAISGFILKSKSPTCGMERVRVYQSKGMPVKNGVGVFARALMQRHPLLPVEEEGRLCDPVLRENFITRIFAFKRWQTLSVSGLSSAKLERFHRTHKLLLMSHNSAATTRLGRMVANSDKISLNKLANQYIETFMQTLQQKANAKKHTNVLMHLQGYLKKQLDKDDKAELSELIERYRTRQVPLIVPLTLLNHHFRKHPNDYVAEQVYLQPHPAELLLRNHL